MGTAAWCTEKETNSHGVDKTLYMCTLYSQGQVILPVRLSRYILFFTMSTGNVSFITLPQ